MELNLEKFKREAQSMKTDLQETVDFLKSLDFVDADAARDFGEKEYELMKKYDQVDYLFKVVNKSYNYVTVSKYFGVVREVIFEQYLSEKNTRRPKNGVKKEELEKRGHVPVKIQVFRDVNKLKNFFSNEL